MFRAVLDTIEGLTTEELLWEPVDGCWSIRSSPEGSYVQDWMPAPIVAPFTTIAWRLAHIGQSLAAHARRLFQRGSFSYETYRPTGSVDGERAFLEESFSLWRDGIDDYGEEFTPQLASEVLSFNHHHLGHAKEIDAIRQLFRAGRPLDDDPLVDACLRGDASVVASMLEESDACQEAIVKTPDLVLAAATMGWWPIVTTLLQCGWPPDTASGVTALHHAAAAGDGAIVALLLEHGADPSRRDPQWDATPRGWAEYFQNTRTVDGLP
jgi:hypothetical protein